jgi:Family of unknown function (DUF5681)
MSAPKDGKSPGAVGYRRPPLHTRFQRGQSGNPAGRRKGQPSVSDLILREAARLVKVKSGDGVETITKHEVVVRQLWKMAMQEDLAAIRLLLMFLAATPDSSGDGDPRDETNAISLPAKPDDETVRRMLARFTHLQPDEKASP